MNAPVELEHNVVLAVEGHLPGRRVTDVKDRGEWGRRIFEVSLDDGQIVFLKMQVHDDWLESSHHEQQVTQILTQYGLPAARVLAVDDSRSILAYPFVIQEWAGGVRLGTLLQLTDQASQLAIYKAIGRFYRRMHHIPGPKTGIWTESPDQPFGSPADFYLENEIIEGSGKRLLEAGRITPATHNRLIAAWQENLAYLKDHQPSLVHGSPFWWNIYLEENENGWWVTKLTSLGDVLWWDEAFDQAMLHYPPFTQYVPAHWRAFQRGYGPTAERKRILLYHLLQRVCAAAGCYMEPKTPQTEAWASTALDGLGSVLDEIANSGESENHPAEIADDAVNLESNSPEAANAPGDSGEIPSDSGDAASASDEIANIS